MSHIQLHSSVLAERYNFDEKLWQIQETLNLNIKRILLPQILVIIFFMGLLLSKKLRPVGKLRKLCGKLRAPSPKPGTELEAINAETNFSGLTVQNLKKTLHSTFREKLLICLTQKKSNCEVVEAIDSISFKVQEGTCLGIFGEKNSGKTTLMEIISGNLVKTEGKCFTNEAGVKIDLDADRHNYREKFGFCPQKLALNGFMTGKEFLNYILRVKGYSRSEVKRRVENITKELKLENYEEKLLSDCSFSIQKRWNIAAAMVIILS